MRTPPASRRPCEDMMLRKWLILLVLGGVGSPVLAQKGAIPGGVRDEIKEKVRALRIARVIEALDLDENGAARLMPILNRAYDQIGEVAKDSGQARRELRSLVGAERRDEARINKLVDRLLANNMKIDELENQMIVDVRRVLTPSQVARQVVVLPEINHQIQQQIRAAARPGAPKPGDDPF